MHYTYEETGLFIGLMTLPYHNPTQFFENEIRKKLFEPYKDGLLKNVKYAMDYPESGSSTLNEDELIEYEASVEAFEKYFYIPKAYCLLGTWDVAVLSLVDDFEFGLRTFQAFSPLSGDDEFDSGKNAQAFSYQVATAVSPEIELPKYGKSIPLTAFWEDTMNFPVQHKSDEPPRPKSKNNASLLLIGSVSLKVNNSILIGNKIELYKKLIRTVAYKCAEVRDSLDKSKESIRFLVLETFCWNEIEVLIFADGFQKISSMIQAIKSLTVQDMFVDGADPNVNHNDLMSHFQSSLVLKHESFSQNKDATLEGLKQCHLFVKSIETLGFDFDILSTLQGISHSSDKDDVVSEEIDRALIRFNLVEDDRVKITQRWFVKPGHVGEIKAILSPKNTLNNEETYVTVGNADFTVTHNSFMEKDVQSVSSKIVVEQLIRSMGLPEIDKHIHQILTIPEVCFNGPLNLVGKKHISFHDELRHMQFSQGKIRETSTMLRQIGVSKIIQGKINNAFAAYNEGVTDSSLYGYFVELFPYLAQLRNTIIHHHGRLFNKAETPDTDIQVKVDSLVDFEDKLNSIAEIFLRAYHNRLQQSHKMLEISDYNLEFKGGVHQLVSALDSVYKQFCVQFRMPEAITYVMSSQGITSRPFAVKLNFHHIYQPEVFFMVIAKEVSNFIYEDFKKIFKEDSYLQEDLDKEKSLFIAFREQLELLNRVVLKLIDRSNHNSNELEKALSKDFGRYIIADLISVLTVFDKDISLYKRCFWLYFIQDSMTYEKIGVVRKENFLQNYLRLLVIKEVFGFAGSLKENIQVLSSEFEDVEIQSEKFINETLKASITLSGTDQRMTLLSCLQIIIEKITGEGNDKNEKSVFPYFRSLGLYKALHHSELVSEEDVIKKLQCILDGEPVDLDVGLFELGKNRHRELEGAKKLKFLTLLFKGYLAYLFRYGLTFPFPVEKPVQKKQTLSRVSSGNVEDTGRPDIELAWKSGKVLVDPRGGVFIVNPTARKMHFKITSAMMRSLWAFGNDYKSNLVPNIIYPLTNFFSEDRSVEIVDKKYRDSIQCFFCHSGTNEEIVLNIKTVVEKKLRIHGYDASVIVFEQPPIVENETISTWAQKWVGSSDFFLMDISLESLTSVRCMEEYMIWSKMTKNNPEQYTSKIIHVVISDFFETPAFEAIAYQKILEVFLDKINADYLSGVTPREKKVILEFLTDDKGNVFDPGFQSKEDMLKLELPYLRDLSAQVRDVRRTLLNDCWNAETKSFQGEAGKEKVRKYAYGSLYKTLSGNLEDKEDDMSWDIPT